MVNDSCANNMLRQHALEIFLSGIAAVDPVAAILRHVDVSDGALGVAGQRFVLSDFENYENHSVALTNR